MAKTKITSNAKGTTVECKSCSHDVRVAQQCADVLAACSEACCGTEGCDQALGLAERSFFAAAAHILNSGCLADGFGIAKGTRGKGGPIKISGLAAANCDSALCADCIDVGLDCIKENGCVQKGSVTVNEDCIQRLLDHALKTGCISKGLGHCGTGKGGAASCCG